MQNSPTAVLTSVMVPPGLIYDAAGRRTGQVGGPDEEGVHRQSGGTGNVQSVERMRQRSPTLKSEVVENRTRSLEW